MTRQVNHLVRKSRTWEQKNKRRSSHQVGKKFHNSTNTKDRQMNQSLKVKMLLDTNKEYRGAETQRNIGSLLVSLPMIYIFVGYLYYGGITIVNSYLLLFASKMVNLGLLGSSTTEQFQEPTAWEVYKSYSFGKPVLVGIGLTFLLVIGVFIDHKAKKKQKKIVDNTDEQRLREAYEKLKMKGANTYD